MNTTPLIAYTIYRRYPETGWAIWKRYKKHLGGAPLGGVGSNRTKEQGEFLTRLGLDE
jgi:hypothetical protein